MTVMREKIDLRKQVIDVLSIAAEMWHFANEERLGKLADRILALLPTMPELRWDGDDIFVGSIPIGNITKGSRKGKHYFMWHNLPVSVDNLISEISGSSDQEARTAVEAAVRKALGCTSASDELPTAEPIPTPSNAADGVLFEEHTEIEP